MPVTLPEKLQIKGSASISDDADLFQRRLVDQLSVGVKSELSKTTRTGNVPSIGHSTYKEPC